jgi:Domain of unknown function (DUF6894)
VQRSLRKLVKTAIPDLDLMGAIREVGSSTAFERRHLRDQDLGRQLFRRTCITPQERAMPRFFFHVQTVDGVNEQDDVGAEFSNETDAVAEARALARELMTDATVAGHNVRHHIEVADENGNQVIRLDCSATIEAKIADGLRNPKR